VTELLRFVVPTSDEVHVWWIDLNAVRDDADDILSPDERARAARFRHQRDRGHWTRARAAIRQLLAGYLGLPPQDIRLTAGTPAVTAIRAKPALANDPRLRFNLAHAGDRAVLAVAWEREVGIDLEPIDAGFDLPPLLRAACTAAEIVRVEALPPELRIEAFLGLWTVKEAYLKGLGVGVFREPRTLEVEFLADGHAIVHDPYDESDPWRWDVRLLNAGPGWVAALAVAGSGCALRRFTWAHADAAS
jgi:4'-phosphopantetheinyl transferase